MYKHNKEVLFVERAEMSAHPFFDSYMKDPEKGMPEGVVAIRKIEPMKIPTKYMLQLGGVHAAQNKVIYMIEFKCRKERDSRF